MFDAKAIEAIQSTAVKAAGAVLLPIADDPRHAYLVVGGEARQVDLPPAPRLHSVQTIDDIVVASEAWEAARCFHNTDQIVLLIDDDDRHDRVDMVLHRSTQFLELGALTKARTITQRDLLKLLRLTFRGCIDEATIQAVRGINFDQQQAGESYIAPGTEKIGKSIAAKAVGASGGSLPEELRLMIPIYTNQGLTQRFPVVVAMDIDVMTQQFTIQTAPGEVESIVNAITEQIHTQLVGAMPNVTVLRGTP